MPRKRPSRRGYKASRLLGKAFKKNCDNPSTEDSLSGEPADLTSTLEPFTVGEPSQQPEQHVKLMDASQEDTSTLQNESDGNKEESGHATWAEYSLDTTVRPLGGSKNASLVSHEHVGSPGSHDSHIPRNGILIHTHCCAVPLADMQQHDRLDFLPPTDPRRVEYLSLRHRVGCARTVRTARNVTPDGLRGVTADVIASLSERAQRNTTQHSTNAQVRSSPLLLPLLTRPRQHPTARRQFQKQNLRLRAPRARSRVLSPLSHLSLLSYLPTPPASLVPCHLSLPILRGALNSLSDSSSNRNDAEAEWLGPSSESLATSELARRLSHAGSTPAAIATSAASTLSPSMRMPSLDRNGFSQPHLSEDLVRQLTMTESEEEMEEARRLLRRRRESTTMSSLDGSLSEHDETVDSGNADSDVPLLIPLSLPSRLSYRRRRSLRFVGVDTPEQVSREEGRMFSTQPHEQPTTGSEESEEKDTETPSEADSVETSHRG